MLGGASEVHHEWSLDVGICKTTEKQFTLNHAFECKAYKRLAGFFQLLSVSFIVRAVVGVFPVSG